MLKEFKCYETVELEAMTNTVAEMQDILDKLDNNEIPSANYPLESLIMFCTSLVNGQRNDMEHFKKGSWSIAPDEPMPSDARVEFVFFPTYIAIAILSKFMQLFPEEASSIATYRSAISMGLLFSTHRRLSGHGYDAVEGMVQAVTILDKGDVPKLLSDDRELSYEMFVLLRSIKSDLDKNITEGRCTAGWGDADFTNKYQQVSEMLDILTSKGEVFLEDIAEIISARGGRATPSNDQNKEYLAIKMMDLRKSNIVRQPNSKLYFSDSDYNRSKLKAGDIVISSLYNSTTLIPEIALIPEDYDCQNSWVASGRMFIIRLKQDVKIESPIVLLWTLIQIIKEELRIEVAQRRLPLLKRAQLGACTINIPVIEKQLKIMSVQEEINAINNDVSLLQEQMTLLPNKIEELLLRT